jgi:4-hydroxybenzoate polyprenyltransferase
MTRGRERRLRLGTDSSLRAYLELLRVPNLLTAMADVAMGFLFVRMSRAPADAGVLAPLLLASTLLYASGVVLNDVFDFAADSRRRPERPLPSGRVSVSAASRLGWALLLLGLVPAWLGALLVGHLGPGMVAVLLAVCILLYDAYLKPTPVGPVLMGGCRMLNVLLGMSVATAAWQTEHYLVAGGIGIYVAGVTWFARTESARSSRLHLALATALMMLGIALLAAFPGWADNLAPPIRLQPLHWDMLMVILAAVIGWRCLRAVIDPSAARVQSIVKLCILWLVVLDAAVCYAVAGAFWAVMILLLLLPATLLGRWIRLT